MVLPATKKGDVLEERVAPGPITPLVHEGRVRFSAADDSVEAAPGMVLACGAGVRYGAEALADPACLPNAVAPGMEA